MIIAGGSAFPRAIDFAPFRDIAREVGAALMADIAHPAGLVAAGASPPPGGGSRLLPAATPKKLPGPPGGGGQCRAGHAPAPRKNLLPWVSGRPPMRRVSA